MTSKFRCDTCRDKGVVDWMSEGDPHMYQEPDSDGKIPCPDCVLHECGYVEDSFACKIRHIQINTGDANSKRSRWDRANDLHNEHHF